MKRGYRPRLLAASLRDASAVKYRGHESTEHRRLMSSVLRCWR